MSDTVIESVADAIRASFPDMENRVLACSDAEVTGENIPDLPVCFVVLNDESSSHSRKSLQRFNITENVAVVFYLEALRYKKNDKGESPFYVYYDYEDIRRRLLNCLHTYRTPHNEPLIYQGLNIEATHFAVAISFGFSHEFQFCYDAQNGRDDGVLMIGQDIEIEARHTQPTCEEYSCD